MRFKLDENFGPRTQRLFRDAGYDVETVLDEKLCGCDDEKLFQVCQEEQRCLVTFDLDFADPLRFPPERCGGIIVVRMPRNPSQETLEALARQILRAFRELPFDADLWIVEPGRIRVHQKDG